MDERWEDLDDEYVDEKPFVKIGKKPHYMDEGIKEKAKKVSKKTRRVAQRFKEFHQQDNTPDD